MIKVCPYILWAKIFILETLTYGWIMHWGNTVKHTVILKKKTLREQYKLTKKIPSILKFGGHFLGLSHFGKILVKAS